MALDDISHQNRKQVSIGTYIVLKKIRKSFGFTVIDLIKTFVFNSSQYISNIHPALTTSNRPKMFHYIVHDIMIQSLSTNFR